MTENSKVTLKLSKEINWNEIDSDEDSDISEFTLVNSEDAQEQVESENLNIEIMKSKVTWEELKEKQCLIPDYKVNFKHLQHILMLWIEYIDFDCQIHQSDHQFNNEPLKMHCRARNWNKHTDDECSWHLWRKHTLMSFSEHSKNWNDYNQTASIMNCSWKK